MPDFELFIDGKKFTHFTEAWCTRRLDAAADEFQITYADLRTDLSEPWPIEAGDGCELRLMGEQILTGYIDDISVQYAAESLKLTARGRSATGDLVDCSAVRSGGRWTNKNIETICNDLCAPFDIAVRVDPFEGAQDPFRRFAVDPGETVMDVIQRACKVRGAWPRASADGSLHIARAASGRTAQLQIEYGKNIISGERYDSWSQRHSDYFVKGQVPSDEEMSKRSSTQQSDFIIDETIERYRPLLLVSTGHDRKGDLKRRAQWERNRRAGTAERILYRVDGYGYESSAYTGSFGTKRQEKFRVWDPNMTVAVKDDRLAVDATLLIAAVSQRFQAEGDDGGRTTDLTLTRKEAFELQDYPKRKRGEKIRSKQTWWDFSPLRFPKPLPSPLRPKVKR